MKWFYNLKIGTKIMLSFISMFLLMCTIGYLGISNIEHMSQNAKTTYKENTVPLTNLIAIGIAYETTRVNLGKMILSKTKKDQDKYIAGFQELDGMISQNMEDFEKTIRNDTIQDEFNNLKKNLNDYNSVREKVITMIHAGKYEDAISLMRENFTIAQAVDDSISKLSHMKTLQVKERYEEDEKLASATVRHTAIVIIIAIIKGLFVGYFVAKMSSRKV